MGADRIREIEAQIREARRPRHQWTEREICLTESSEWLLARVRDLEAALAQIDRMLTTVSGDNVPWGEAPKMHVRNIARAALSGGSPANEASER